MDLFTFASPTSLFATMPALSIALFVWFAELRRKSDSAGIIGVTPSFFVQFVRRLGPELAGFLSCVIAAALLIMWSRDLGFSRAFYAEHDVHGRWNPAVAARNEKVQEKIQSSWPLLGGADSLLAVQAMLRLVLVASASCRAWAGESLALVGAPSSFFLLAATCRLVILAFSPLEVFYLDGPLGGMLNAAFEVAAVPPLLFLSVGAVKQSSRSFLLSAAGVLSALAVAHTNQFKLAYDEKFQLDAFFSLVQLLDALGAVAFVLQVTSFWNGLKAQVGVGSVVVHVLLPLQQLFAAYFFLVAFSEPLEIAEPLVRRGRPFEMMWACGAAQVGCSLAAGALYFAACVDGYMKDELPATNAQELIRAVEV